MAVETKKTPRKATAKKGAAKKTGGSREETKKVKAALEVAGLDPSTKLSPTQRSRAAEYPEKRGGLRGVALRRFIMEGKSTGEQTQESKAARQKADKEKAARKNVTRSSDPAATELAQKAKALTEDEKGVPTVKSAFLPKDARCFLDDILKRKKPEQLLKGAIKGEDKKKEDLPQERLEAFAIGGQKDPQVRAFLAELGKGTRLWGRKLGLMILAKMG